MKDVLVKNEWFKCIKYLLPEIQDKIIADVIREELGTERAHKDMVAVNMLVNYIRGRMHNV